MKKVIYEDLWFKNFRKTNKPLLISERDIFPDKGFPLRALQSSTVLTPLLYNLRVSYYP